MTLLRLKPAAPQSPVKHSTTEPEKNYTEGKSLAIYFWDSQFRRNRIFNLIMSKICVDECSRRKSQYILLIAVKSLCIHLHIFIFPFYSRFGGNRLIILILTLQITFAKCLDLDQAQHCIGPDLDLNCLTLVLSVNIICKIFGSRSGLTMRRPDLHQDCLELLLSVYLKEFFLKSSFEIMQQTTNKSMQGLLGSSADNLCKPNGSRSGPT